MPDFTIRPTLNGSSLALLSEVSGATPSSVQTEVRLMEHWMGAYAEGVLGWNVDGENGGGNSFYYASTETRPSFESGVIRVHTGTNNNGAGRAGLSKNFAPSGLRSGVGVTTIRWRARLEQLSNATDEFTVEIGLSGDGPRFRYNRAASVNWLCVWRNRDGSQSGVENSATSTLAVDTSYHWFRIVTNADWSSVAFYIDDVLVGTVADPASAQTASASYARSATGNAEIVKSAGTATCGLRLDAFELIWNPVYV